MASNNGIAIPPKTEAKEEEELSKLKLSLPKVLLFNRYPLYLYQGCWLQELDPVIAMEHHFQAQDTDIFITSSRKTGTTWLKALIFSICNRANYNLPSESNNPLLTHNPHELVPHLESNIYAKSKCPNHINSLKPPRVFGTHLPFHSLPTSIKDSKCKVIYICRNPLDTFVSSWLFYKAYDGNKNLKPEMIGYFFDLFCEGKIPFGPFEDHVLGYWREILERPEKVLFVKYEDLKVDPKPQLKKMAEFVGFPFSAEEDTEGVVDGIIKLCSFKGLKEVEAAVKTPTVYPGVRNEWFFRKGEVGDWVNYLTPEMVMKIEKLMEEKLRDSGLIFK